MHEELCDILGSRNVYFQPPENLKMKYPCIRYSNATPDIKRANDRVYGVINRYEGIIIDLNPDSTIATSVLEHFPMCSISNSYVTDNLNHTPFTLYY